MPTGSPEAQGKAELLMAVISSINKWQGYTVGASRVVSHVAGSLSKHRRIIHEVRPSHMQTSSLTSYAVLRQAPTGFLYLVCPDRERMQHDGSELRTVEYKYCRACGGVWSPHHGDAHLSTAAPARASHCHKVARTCSNTSTFADNFLSYPDDSCRGWQEDLEPEECVDCRAALLDALQKVGMRHRPSRQRWATEILKATKGTDLTRLKAFVDDGGVGARDLYGGLGSVAQVLMLVLIHLKSPPFDTYLTSSSCDRIITQSTSSATLISKMQLNKLP